MPSREGLSPSHDLTKRASRRQAMQFYLNLGRRVFASHRHGVVAELWQGAEPPLSVVVRS